MAEVTVTCSQRTGNGYSRPRCTREAEVYPTRAEDGPDLHNILCRVHEGYKKRSRYFNPDYGFVAITDEQMADLREQVAAIRKEKAKEAAVQQTEAEARERQRFAQAWAETEAAPGAFFLRRDDNDHTPEDEQEWWGFVTPDGTEPTRYPSSRMYRSDHKWVGLEPAVRSFWGGKDYPYVINVSRGGNLSAPEARALAKVLTEAADKAEELNVSRKPA